MLRNIEIKNFRGFRQYSLHDAGRINLLVGLNNCGKTTLLEAIRLLTCGGNIAEFAAILEQRGEVLGGGLDGRRIHDADISHLFYGHKLEKNSRFSVEANADSAPEVVTIYIGYQATSANAPQQSNALDGELFESGFLNMEWKGSTNFSGRSLPITSRGGISQDDLQRMRWTGKAKSNSCYVSTAALNAELIAASFGKIALNPEEELIINSLRILEPKLERIAIGGPDDPSPRSMIKGGVYIKLRGVENRIPIGSLGDGMWRMLGLSLAMAQAEKGILLVDDIDTGLHHIVMRDMWRLVYETAKRLDIQVFATTHSRDCVQSLATISRGDVSKNSEITIHRIEPEKPESIRYTEQQIVIAAEQNIEVR
ncbi:MAG: AAA family ATPase [Candidatus Sumerlaeota bacterium]|nr:AAA family ATPase [Candidatus Sumerlaeota bacterium]